MTTKLLDPKLDLVFKRLFCEPGNEQALLRFLNLIFKNRGLPEIIGIRILNPYVDGKMLDEKLIVLDILAETATGEIINVEIQLRNHQGFKERMMFYLCRNFSKQLLIGEDYKSLKRTVSIFLLNFGLTDSNDYHSVYWMAEKRRQEPLTDKLELHVIELLKIPVHAENSDIEPALLHWLKFLVGVPESDWEQLSEDENELRKVMSTLKSLSDDEQMKYWVEAREKWLSVEASMRATAYEEGMAAGRADGLAAGIAEGKVEGIAEGKAAGIAEGKAEGIQQGAQEKQRELAIGMLNEGIPLETIIKLTGYSTAELEVLKNPRG